MSTYNIHVCFHAEIRKTKLMWIHPPSDAMILVHISECLFFLISEELYQL